MPVSQVSLAAVAVSNSIFTPQVDQSGVFSSALPTYATNPSQRGIAIIDANNAVPSGTEPSMLQVASVFRDGGLYSSANYDIINYTTEGESIIVVWGLPTGAYIVNVDLSDGTTISPKLIVPEVIADIVGKSAGCSTDPDFNGNYFPTVTWKGYGNLDGIQNSVNTWIYDFNYNSLNGINQSSLASSGFAYGFLYTNGGTWFPLGTNILGSSSTANIEGSFGPTVGPHSEFVMAVAHGLAASGTINPTDYSTYTELASPGEAWNFIWYSTGEVCGEVVYGCTDSFATNYDATATVNNGECIYCGYSLGSTYTSSSTNPADIIVTATILPIGTNVGFPNYTYAIFQNGNLLETIPASSSLTGTFETTFTAGDQNLVVHATDAQDCQILSNPFSIPIDLGVVQGCTDPNSPNYNVLATNNDGSCIGCAEEGLSTTMSAMTAVTQSPALGGEPAVVSLAIAPSQAVTAAGILVSTYNLAGYYVITASDAAGTVVYNSQLGVGVLNQSISGTFLSGHTYDVVITNSAFPACTSLSQFSVQSLGCTDPIASNYDNDATFDAGCVYTYDIFPNIADAAPNDPCYSLLVGQASEGVAPYSYNWNTGGAGSHNHITTSGNYYFVVTDANGVTATSAIFNVSLEICGCTNPAYQTYNPNATNMANLGACSGLLGCTDSQALNFNPLADVDNGVCLYPIYGCTDPAAINYSVAATDNDNSCVYVPDPTTVITTVVAETTALSEIKKCVSNMGALYLKKMRAGMLCSGDNFSHIALIDYLLSKANLACLHDGSETSLDRKRNFIKFALKECDDCGGTTTITQTTSVSLTQVLPSIQQSDGVINLLDSANGPIQEEDIL